MPPRHQFYDPIVQQGDQVAEIVMPPIRGLPVSVVGMYLLAPDVSMWLRRLAETHHDDDARRALYEAADLIDDSGLEPEQFAPPEEQHPPPEQPPVMAPVGLPPAGVARIEMFPNEDASYWYARVVDEGGNIVAEQGIVEGVNSALVEQQATARWPGVPVYAVADALGDSIWDEQVTIFGFNGRRRPSPRRLWA